MDKWAVRYSGSASFLCVGVAGSGLSAKMGQEMKLANCTNCFIAKDSDMPSYGQLGCGGFIVLDSEHKVVSSCTSAFMQVRELAFKHVEALLDALAEGRAQMPWPCPGELLTVKGLQASPELNGQTAVCIAAAPAGAGERTTVELQSGRSIRVRPSNLVSESRPQGG